MVPSGRSDPHTRTQDPMHNTVRSQGPPEARGELTIVPMMATASAMRCCVKVSMVEEHSSRSCERTSAGRGQTRIRIEVKTLTSHHEIGTSKVGKTGGTNTTPVWSVRTITGLRAFSTVDRQRGAIRLRNKIDPHLSLRGLDGSVSLAGWN